MVVKSSDRLTRGVRDTSGNVIATRDEAKRYVLGKLEKCPLANSWNYAAKLLIEDADAEAITKRIDYALFLDGALDMRRCE